MHNFSWCALILHDIPMEWLFGGGVLFAHGRFHLVIYILQGSLRLVMEVVWQLLDILYVLQGIYKTCYWLSTIFFMGTSSTPRVNTFFWTLTCPPVALDDPAKNWVLLEPVWLHILLRYWGIGRFELLLNCLGISIIPVLFCPMRCNIWRLIHVLIFFVSLVA